MGPAVYRRPLLATRDPVVALEELLARRASLYAEADITLDTESLTVDETVATLETLLREQLGG
jgi:shikimate kinase